MLVVRLGAGFCSGLWQESILIIKMPVIRKIGRMDKNLGAKVITDRGI
jgi:hypothetical protein